MSTKARGTKRTCQNSDCGVRFYDLNRNPVVCPVCNSEYVIAVSPTAVAAVAGDAARKPSPKKPEFKAKEPVAADAPEAESEDALPDIETADDDVAPGEDETFLEEEEEDGGDVSNILGGPVAEEGEEP